jgi:hypothetical protein
MSRSSSALIVLVIVSIHSNLLAGFASSVVSYAPGDGIAPTFQQPASALGMPAGDTSFGVLTPFNAAFLGSHIVGVGAGGSLVLQLDQTAPTNAGATIGIHAAVGLIDTDWPNGNAGPTATPYTNPRAAEVFVSDDGARWHSLGSRTFDIPTNFYSHGVTTPGLQMEPGTQVADFTKPFTRPLSDFDGRNWPAILTLLDGSAGGQWLDLSSVPYPAVNFIRFDAGPGQTMYVDAVAVIPEPAALGMVVTVIALRARRRRS